MLPLIFIIIFLSFIILLLFKEDRFDLSNFKMYLVVIDHNWFLNET